MSKLFKYLSIGFLLTGVYFFIKERKAENEKAQLETIKKLSAADTLNHVSRCDYTKTGTYYVHDTIKDGITVYKDVLKKRKFSSKAMPLSEIRIDKIENGMGHSEWLFGEYVSSGGWVEMKNLLCADEMFPEKDKGVYLVKSTEIDGVDFYKDGSKLKKFRQKLKHLEEIKIYKIKNGMGYSKGHYNTDLMTYVNGWVEMKKLEWKEKGYVY